MRRYTARLLPLVVVAVLCLVLGDVLHPLSYLRAVAQGQCRTFPETGQQVCGRFLEYWDQRGGLAQQGYPISGRFTEVSDLNGKPYEVQYFERAVFELHPENQAPNDVLLSQLGTLRYREKYGAGGPPAVAPTQAPPAPTAPATKPGSYSFSGHGKQVTKPFPLLKGALRWHCISRNGQNNFIVHVVNATTGKIEAFLANEIGASDSSGIDSIGSTDFYAVDVEFDGDWQVILEQ